MWSIYCRAVGSVTQRRVPVSTLAALEAMMGGLARACGSPGERWIAVVGRRRPWSNCCGRRGREHTGEEVLRGGLRVREAADCRGREARGHSWPTEQPATRNCAALPMPMRPSKSDAPGAGSLIARDPTCLGRRAASSGRSCCSPVPATDSGCMLQSPEPRSRAPADVGAVVDLL